MNRLKNYFSKEIGIEYKSCLYFFAMLFFYCVYRMVNGKFSADILIMAEIIFAAYLMCYLQVYVLRNFDEGEVVDKFTCLSVLFCSVAYTGISYWLRWFDRNGWVTLLYFLYMVFMYICMFLINKIKREIDTKQLNEELEVFKKNRELE